MIQFLQTFHDFPEIMTESISSYSRGDNGLKETRWNKKEIEEIVIAQVIENFEKKN